MINSARRQEANNKRLKKVPSIDDASNQETGVLLVKSPDAINEAKEQVSLNVLVFSNLSITETSAIFVLIEVDNTPISRSL